MYRLTSLMAIVDIKRKVQKFCHTRYRALGPELIPVYRQSACRWLSKSSPAVGCHYFPLGCGHLPSRRMLPSLPVLSYMAYCSVTEARRCEQLAQDCCAALSRWELNPWPTDRKSNALSLRHYATTSTRSNIDTGMGVFSKPKCYKNNTCEWDVASTTVSVLQGHP